MYSKKITFIKSNCKLEKLGTAQPTLALLARYHAISHYAITTSTSKKSNRVWRVTRTLHTTLRFLRVYVSSCNYYRIVSNWDISTVLNWGSWSVMFTPPVGRAVVRGPNNLTWRTWVSRPFWCIKRILTWMKCVRNTPVSSSKNLPMGILTQSVGSVNSITCTSFKSWNVVPTRMDIFLGV